MAEVVKNSTQYLTRCRPAGDRGLPEGLPAEQQRSRRRRRSTSDGMARGEALYIDNCTGCHMHDGGGIAKRVPAAQGAAPPIQAREPETVLHVVLGGETDGRRPRPSRRPRDAGVRLRS